jgi:hypothetical protein
MIDAVEPPGFRAIGWVDAGLVEQMGSEAIVTEFFEVIVPVRAGKSFYRFRTRAGEFRRFEIPRHRRSVVLGFVRTPLWLATVVLLTPAFVDLARWWPFVLLGLAFGAVAAFATFRAGQLDGAERERRELLARVVGLGAPPELIPEDMLEEMRDDLADAWFHETQIEWRQAIHDRVASETLVALAEYHRSPQLLIRARTNLIDAEGN